MAALSSWEIVIFAMDGSVFGYGSINQIKKTDLYGQADAAFDEAAEKEGFGSFMVQLYQPECVEPQVNEEKNQQERGYDGRPSRLAVMQEEPIEDAAQETAECEAGKEDSREKDSGSQDIGSSGHDSCRQWTEYRCKNGNGEKAKTQP